MIWNNSQVAYNNSCLFIAAPVVELVVSSATPTLGDNISLECSVTDKSFVKLEWSKNGAILANNDTLLIDKSTIAITDTQMISDDVFQSTISIANINHTLSDSYTCAGYNPDSVTSESVNIQVQG